MNKPNDRYQMFLSDDGLQGFGATYLPLDCPRDANPLCVDPDPALGWKKPKKHRFATWRAECYCIGVFPYEGLHIGIPMILYPTGLAQPLRNNTDGFHHLQLAMTRDLVHWKRLGNREPFIGPSRITKGLAGVFDRMSQSPPNRPIEHDDELWFYYGGAKRRCDPYTYYTDGSRRDPATLTAEERADQDDGAGAVCLAVLRRDGFISLDAGETEGSVQTKAFTLPGGKLFVNVDAFKGELGVEVVGENGKALAVSKSIKGDLPRGEVKWQKGSIADLKGKAVSLGFTLRNASLYSYWLQ